MSFRSNRSGSDCLRVDGHQHIHAAPRTAGGDARQPAGGRFGEVHRKIRHDQNPKRLGHFAGEFVVLVDRLEIVAQIFLDHVFHVLGQVGQPGFDVLRLGPDAVGDQHFVEIGQVHEAGEILAPARPDR